VIAPAHPPDQPTLGPHSGRQPDDAACREPERLRLFPSNRAADVGERSADDRRKILPNVPDFVVLQHHQEPVGENQRSPFWPIGVAASTPSVCADRGGHEETPVSGLLRAPIQIYIFKVGEQVLIEHLAVNREGLQHAASVHRGARRRSKHIGLVRIVGGPMTCGVAPVHISTG